MQQGSKGKILIKANAIVPSDCTLEGNIIIGEGTVLHPYCKIVARPGTSIIIGKFNIIEEFVTISTQNRPPGDDGSTLYIGDHNVFEVGSQIFADRIGDRNVIETRAILSDNTVVGNDTVVGVYVRLPPHQSLPNSTVTVTPHNSPRTATDTHEAHMAVHKLHLQLLHSTLPKFHRLSKPNASTSPTPVNAVAARRASTSSTTTTS